MPTTDPAARWRQITADARERVSSRLGYLHQGTPGEEVLLLMQAIDAAMSNEILAATYNQTVDDRIDTLEKPAALRD